MKDILDVRGNRARDYPATACRLSAQAARGSGGIFPSSGGRAKQYYGALVKHGAADIAKVIKEM
jgi:hypothetical protein